MNLCTRFFAALATALCLSGAVHAQDRGTREEAKAMLDAAVAHVKKVGPDKAFEDFTKDKANWTKKDLYVVANDLEGVSTANGANEKLVGKSLINLRDHNGKEFVKEIVAVGSGKGEGWVDYDVLSPASKKVERKSTLIKRIAGTNFVVGVGIYR